MNRAFLWMFLLLFSVVSCTKKNSEAEHTATEGELSAQPHTLYSDKTELFVEFTPLIKGETSKFATHLTVLGENFLPLTEGTVTVSLVTGKNGIRNSATAPSSPGIYRLALKPEAAGTGTLIFDIKTKNYTDQIVIENVKIYADKKAALQDQKPEEGGSDITYLKEQAWKTEFANAEVKAGILIGSAISLANFVPYNGLLLLWILAGIGQTLADMPSETLIGENIDPQDQGKVYGSHFAFSHLWWAFAYPVAGFLGSRFPQNDFLYGGILTLILAGIAVLVLKPFSRNKKAEKI